MAENPDSTKNTWNGIKKSLGPGLLMAAAAIGVSHLVQSTRAGAHYGLALVWAVVLANLFKYPFLEYGPRYAVATGESMIEGYRKLGSWAIGIYVFFTLGTVFVIQAAVTIVSANLAIELTGIALSPFVWSVILLVICVAVLLSGHYSALDGAIKLMMIILAVSTIFAFGAALLQGPQHQVASFYPDIWNVAGVSFLIALMGWMPIPIDAAAWHSLWSLERQKQTHYRPSLKESLFDFNIGYIGAAVLALCFLGLGTLVMYGSNQTFASSGTAFADQLINLYTDSLGSWAYTIIIICAFTTMFSTTFTVADAYPRVIARFSKELMPQLLNGVGDRLLYRILLVVIPVFSMTTLYFMGRTFTLLIDFAATLSFLMAPVLAYINYRLVTADHVPDEFQPKPWMRWLSRAGLLFLLGFALLYIYWMLRF